jgi:hypothetical protein
MAEELPFVDFVITPVASVLADHVIISRLDRGLIAFLVRPGARERDVVRDEPAHKIMIYEFGAVT